MKASERLRELDGAIQRADGEARATVILALPLIADVVEATESLTEALVVGADVPITAVEWIAIRQAQALSSASLTALSDALVELTV